MRMAIRHFQKVHGKCILRKSYAWVSKTFCIKIYLSYNSFCFPMNFRKNCHMFIKKSLDQLECPIQESTCYMQGPISDTGRWRVRKAFTSYAWHQVGEHNRVTTCPSWLFPDPCTHVRLDANTGARQVAGIQGRTA